MTAEHNTGLVRRVVEDVWNRGDLALANALVAPDYVNHGGLIPELAHGPEAIKVAVALYRTAFPTFHITVEALVAEGATVELRWTAHRSLLAARTEGALADAEGTLRGTTRSRLADDQIAENWMSWDRAAVLRNLERIPAETGPRPDPSDH